MTWIECANEIEEKKARMEEIKAEIEDYEKSISELEKEANEIQDFLEDPSFKEKS